MRMLTICLTDEALWWLHRAADNVFFSRTAVFLDFRAMVDVPRLCVSRYYYNIISTTALDLLLFWAKQFYLLGNIKSIVLIYPGAGYLVCG